MDQSRSISAGLAALLAVSVSSQAAIIGSDGGITLYVSYDNPDLAGGASWNDDITQVNSATGASCNPTNNARAALGAPASPGSCPGGDTCLGREKLTGDIENLAEYIFESTEGAHYLRRAYLSDNGRAWNNADIRWSIGSGGSSAPGNGWTNPGSSLNLRSANRRCIHDVVHHELGHYFYNLPDRYARTDGYYQGTIDGGPQFSVAVTTGDPNTVMAGNFPHKFVDTTNAEITVDYTNPGDPAVVGEVLTPNLLSDGDPDNDGPDRAHHGHTHPFAQDEWSLLPSRHADLTGVHFEGDFSDPDFSSMPDVETVFLGEDEPHPGTVLLLDRSGSMSVLTDGVPASQFVQEAGMYLYHSSLNGDLVGTNLYNAAIEVLFNYDVYDASNQLLATSFRPAQGLTNIAAALESAIDAMIAEHGADGTHGGQILLMSDGKQTTGPDLWDQVDRAVDQGILIHTLSFGNADTATMNAIAGATDGDVIEMSETTDAAELKHGMSREMSELRGQTPVYFRKGGLRANSEQGRFASHAGQFEVPPNSRTVQYYVFLRNGNAAYLDVQLEDPAGNIYKAEPKNVAQLGRLNGLSVPGPLKGKWTFRVTATDKTHGRLPVDDYELIGYIDNRDLDTQLSVQPAGKQFPGLYRVQAQLSHRYPLTKIQAVADIYRDNHLLISLPLSDNGEPGIDDQDADGTYSGLFDPRQFDLNRKRPKVRIDVRFTTSEDSMPAPKAHYETGTEMEQLVKDFKQIAKHEFTAYATDTVSLSHDDEYRPRLVTVEPKYTRLKPGSEGKLIFVVDNAFVSERRLRVSLGSEVDLRIDKVQHDKDRLRSTVTLVYRVHPNATGGTRDLTVQFNRTRLEQRNVLWVGYKPKLELPTRIKKLQRPGFTTSPITSVSKSLTKQ